MKGTQLYIEDHVFQVLKRLSRGITVPISKLVRAAIRKVYALEKPEHPREVAGLWNDVPSGT